MTADRDQSIERLLRETRGAEPGASDDCPDAETLAAMADDALPNELRREIESHVAGCPRCQELTAAMVRAEVPVGAMTPAGPGLFDPSWWKRRALNWLVPAAAAATAVALWVLVPGQQAPTPTAPAADTQATATPPPLPPLTPEVIVTEPLRIPGAAREEAAAASPAPPAAAAPPPPPAAPPATTPALPAPPAAPLPRPRAESELKAESPAVGGLQASAGAERRDQAALNETVALQDRAVPAQGRRAASVDVVSPDPRVRWSVGPGPIVQRSTDGGATWIAQQTGAPAELTAGSAPTVDVCWLVGRGGVIVRTTDGGRQWQRVAFPEAVDLTAVTATNALIATVSLADGRRYATTDGGTTWVALR